MPLLEAKAVRKTYHIDAARTEVLKGVDLALPEKALVAILGSSGAGKSTLLHVLSSLEPPDEGRVFYDGEDLYARSDEALALLRNRDIGFVFQAHHLLPEFTALENVMMPLLIRGEGKKETQKKSLELLERFGLRDRALHLPAEMSGGEQQRIAVARAMVGHPRILFADEPTGNLDHANGDILVNALLEWHHERDMALVMVTHNPEIAEKFPQKIHLENGCIRRS